jgi:hypothetical protein
MADGAVVGFEVGLVVAGGFIVAAVVGAAVAVGAAL